MKINKARSMLMTSIVFYEILFAFQTRSDKYNVVQMGLDGFIGNRFLALSFIVSVILKLVLLNIPALSKIFDLTPLTLRELGVCMIGGLGSLLLIPGWFIKETEKNHN